MSYNPEYRTPIKKTDSPFVSAYSVKIQTPLTFPENSPHTRQEFKAESDINTIMSQYARTGEMPKINELAPQFLDVSQNMDFQTHMNYVREAQELFDALPSQVRNRFQNDPGAFIDFTSDENNRSELAKMGLLSTEATRAILSPSPPSSNPLQSPVGAQPENGPV
jgi:phage internal scaffolding protein